MSFFRDEDGFDISEILPIVEDVSVSVALPHSQGDQAMGNVEGQGPEHSGGVSRSDFDRMVALQDQRYEESEERYLKDRSESREQRRLQYAREEEQRLFQEEQRRADLATHAAKEEAQLAKEEEQDRVYQEIREKSRIAEASIKNACIQRITENSRMLKNELDQVSERLESKMEDI